jgi:flagellar biosynthesis protein FlhF
MNFQRFIAPTSREALAKARLTFGEGTLILSNRQTPNGVEVVATTEDSLATLDQMTPSASSAAAPLRREASPMVAPRTTATSVNETHTPVADDAAQLAMSTLSFQDYVRERMLQRRHEAAQRNQAATAKPPARSHYEIIPPDTAEPIQTRKPVASTPVQSTRAAPAVRHETAPAQRTTRASAPPATDQTGLVNELHAMKELIEERFSTMTWLGQTKQHPIRANLILKLIRAGYSPDLARTILDKLPNDTGAAESVRWLMSVLERNLRTDAGARPLHEVGGVFGMVGATGVGKTTTTAKLAALCAQTHGAGSVGLISLDSYRIGAQEQLRAYGRMLGVVVHTAHDRAALQDLLGLLSSKKMVLIDSSGVAPRDPRKREMLDTMDLPQVQRLLVLNAASHGDVQNEVVASFRARGVQQAVLTKIDEAVKLGPVLDTAIRHRLVLRGVTTGQKVPGDWERADAAQLVALSMRSSGKSVFDPQMADLGMFFAQPMSHAQGSLHA